MSHETLNDQQQASRTGVSLFIGRTLNALGTGASMAAELAMNSARLDLDKRTEELRLDHDRRELETLRSVSQRYTDRLLEKKDDKFNRELSSISPIERERLGRIAIEIGLGQLGVSRGEAVQFSRELIGTPEEERIIDLHEHEAELASQDADRELVSQSSGHHW